MYLIHWNSNACPQSPSAVLTCRLRMLVMFAMGNEMPRLVLLVLCSHLESSSTVRSLSNLCRPSTWKGMRSTMLALLPHSDASMTCTIFSISSWKWYKPGGKAGGRRRRGGGDFCEMRGEGKSLSELRTLFFEEQLSARACSHSAFGCKPLQLLNVKWATTGRHHNRFGQKSKYSKCNLGIEMDFWHKGMHK